MRALRVVLSVEIYDRIDVMEVGEVVDAVAGKDAVVENILHKTAA